MNLRNLADEAELYFHERRDALDALERAIAHGRSKRPLSDLQSRRGRLPAAAAIARALRAIADRAGDLPPDLLAFIERDA